MYRRLTIPLGAFLVLAGCGRSDTGVQISMRVGNLEFDELRIRVTRALADPGGEGTETLVDPATKGRFGPPFRPGDQSVVVYLSDALDGSVVHCEASAMRAGAGVGSGAGDVTVERETITTLEIVMAPPGGGQGTGTGGTPAPAGGNGAPCSVGGECLTGHCVDGVCCESDCKMACRSCALPDSKGLCRPVPGGTPDPRGQCDDKGPTSCQTNGLCDGAGDCAAYPLGTPCGPPGCAEMDTAAVPGRTCNGAGKCEDQPKMKCPEPSRCVAGICS